MAGFYGEAVRSVDVKMARRNGSIRSFAMSGKIGRDTSLKGDLRGRPQGRDIILIETDDAGAFFRFTDTYGKMFGGQLALAMDPPTAEPRAKQGLINVSNFTIKGEAALDRAAAGLVKIRDHDGPGALAGFGSAKGSNEEAYLFQKLVRTGFG
ncbi:MAG: hypothetical protein J0H57_02695, partial [Rhodospirillales bacterium]|nr:hypothetical protein [Rhodospirillales bacterium]